MVEAGVPPRLARQLRCHWGPAGFGAGPSPDGLGSNEEAMDAIRSTCSIILNIAVTQPTALAAEEEFALLAHYLATVGSLG